MRGEVPGSADRYRTERENDSRERGRGGAACSATDKYRTSTRGEQTRLDRQSTSHDVIPLQISGGIICRHVKQGG